MDNPAITREALEKYLTRRVEEIGNMNRFLDEKKFEEIAMLSHKIKGSAHTFGLDGVGSIAERIEDCIEKSELKDITDCLNEMEIEVRGALEKLT